VDYRAPARLDDALAVSAALRECRRASLVFAQEIRRDGALLLDAEVRVAALDAGGFRPRPIPEPLYAQLKTLEMHSKETDA
jgi:acyl-CoA thioester hydrolase